MKIIEVSSTKEIAGAAALAVKLWPHQTQNALEQEFKDLLTTNKHVLFMSLEEQYTGFIHFSLRFDYVEGTFSSPVGYVEGIYVEERARNKGTAAALLRTGEQWARHKGCLEIASDVVLGNEKSYKFHEKNGFTEVNRIVCYAKKL
ncbi:aminoglycoside 6'-N-acetyltransferase [Alkalicoccus daliensis]|uniref:Aminoglycoside N(6')-acetyltransferase type 1 n=1 Tax=Alkalicoccus daliensis TaxID=745820 RepID=A0A1H0GWG9_9BACI|nr:aminoglycoside 6'-N-acetyltransferase [Alkalicoccus daliensis]SDO11386.1 aminoglycoside 6'-N-acetyltransferase I [Alkalicoccus daliensis]